MDEHSTLLNFIKNYGEAEQIQASDAALFDAQIKNLSLPITTSLSKSTEGTVFDIGCGNGIILCRLLNIENFVKINGWQYVGADHIENHDVIYQIAIKNKIHKRVELITLEELYETSWMNENATQPLICVVRNVFHELDIPQTTKLCVLLNNNLVTGDTLLIQDLQVFPKAERNNVCWQPSYFKSLLNDCGFSCHYVVEPSKSGNKWFTFQADRNNNANMTYDDIFNIVAKYKKQQYVELMNAEALTNDDQAVRMSEIVRLDFDLQLFALHRQLLAVQAAGITPITPTQESKIAFDTFSKHLYNFNVSTFISSIDTIDTLQNFRDRANSQDSLEKFLIEKSRVAIIKGGAYMGKSVLVKEVLSKRAHSRKTVIIDIQSNSSVWNLVESYLSAIGCTFAIDILSDLKSIKFSDIAKPLQELIYKLSEHTIIVFDHFERLLNPYAKIQDSEIVDFLFSLCNANNAKVIITTRKAPVLNFVKEDGVVDDSHPPVGRFPRGEHVENLLDDFIDRSKQNIQHYPDDLLNAIDRVPHLAVLAAKIIKLEGLSSLQDKSLLQTIRARLREDLIRRIVDDESRPVVELLTVLRIPVPKEMLIDLASEKSVIAAENLGLIYKVYDCSDNYLVSGIGALHSTKNNDDLMDENEIRDETKSDEDKKHEKIAAWYSKLYRGDNDPKWLREIYYHTLAAGDMHSISKFGVLYKSELFWAGNYWFRVRRDYEASLEAFQTARNFGLESYTVELRIAACHMRLGHDQGHSEYEKLIQKYPDSGGVISSYIDSLLYLSKFQEALDKLSEFNFQMEYDYWTAHQYGRAYFGLRQFENAITAFRKNISLNSDHFAYFMLAKSHAKIGNSEEVGQVLQEGIKRYKDNKALKLSYASHLIQKGFVEDLNEAKLILESLHVESPTYGGVLHQLCKLYCLEGNTEKAKNMLDSIEWQVYPEKYLKPIKVEIFIGQKQWENALSELNNIAYTDEHLVGLKKKIFLRWATSEGSIKEKILIAKRGLDVQQSLDISNNIPMLVTSAKLASIAEDEVAFEKYIAEIKAINENVANMILEQDEDIHYWEEDAFIER
ncbi:hypothetical protein [Seleniivibrio woodruffii]|uniref:hypothetical protein n=1 Tax=Seleniivibrio woodruffii TaxID=1078050 RepID=UPI00240A0D00|nr:hypothetical protein [Seleniivibrio woodruffii]